MIYKKIFYNNSNAHVLCILFFCNLIYTFKLFHGRKDLPFVPTIIVAKTDMGSHNYYKRSLIPLILGSLSAYPNLSGVIWRAGFSPPNLVGKFRPFED